jgi:hypothetical protein
MFDKLLSYFLLRMSSLNFSLFNPDENENYISSKKKISHNRTQKRYVKEPFLTEKVSKVLDTIHNNNEEEEEGSHLADFTPPPPPTSMGAERTKMPREPMQNLGSFNAATQNEYSPSLGNQPAPLSEGEDYDLNNFKTNYGDSKSVEDYYKKYIPNYSNANLNLGSKGAYNRPYYQAPQNSGNNQSQNYGNEVLVAKLNYMINLLEEKQDERTNNVTEEVVLYSFLGIFIIFIVDSFSRVGKYVR